MVSLFSDTQASPSAWGWAALTWGVLGFLTLLAEALYRLGPIAWEAMSSGVLGVWHWLLAAAWVAIMAYAEGYRGFQKRFSPRFAARAMLLAEAPSLGRGILAPLFCMGLFHATKRVLIVSWGIVLGVVILILAIRQLEQPWRGIIDAGVVVGLAWGFLASVGWLIQAVRRRPLPMGPDMPAAPALSTPEQTLGTRNQPRKDLP